MADKYLNYTVLSYYNGRIAAIYATKAELPTKVSDLANDSGFITSSGVPITTVKVNNTALTPDANKAVNVTVPTTVASLSDASTYANKIEKIKVNNVEQSISSKTVNIAVPTTVASLSDASNYALKSEIPSTVAELSDASTYANKIETVKVNGTALTITSKAVDVSVPTTVASLSDASTYANKIEKIKVNNVEQSISSKAVNITVPTTVASLSDASDYALAANIPDAVSDLTNDTGFITSSDIPIATVKVNNAALTPDSNKAVNVTVPTTVASLSDASTYANKIETIKVNNTEQTITSKTVNITVPTKVSDLTNDSGFQTASDVSSAISSAISGVYTYKGSVATYADLPASGNVAGDVWDVQADGTNYAWTGTTWDALGGTVDLSLYWSKAELVAITTAEIDALFA